MVVGLSAYSLYSYWLLAAVIAAASDKETSFRYQFLRVRSPPKNMTEFGAKKVSRTAQKPEICEDKIFKDSFHVKIYVNYVPRRWRCMLSHQKLCRRYHISFETSFFSTKTQTNLLESYDSCSNTGVFGILRRVLVQFALLRSSGFVISSTEFGTA